MRRTDEAPDPFAWAEARQEILRWVVDGKVSVELNNQPIDIVTIATMDAASELDGYQFVIYDQEVLDAWRGQFSS
jgi:hypothetical protein